MFTKTVSPAPNHSHHSSLHDLFTAAAGVSEESAALLGEDRPSEGASPFPPPPPPPPLPMTQGVGRRQPITAVPATQTPNNAATWMGDFFFIRESGVILGGMS